MRVNIFALLFVTVFLFTNAVNAREQFLDIQTITSKSGINAWLVEDHSIPVITIQFSFGGAGALLDGEAKQGLSRIVSNMLDEGAGELDSQSFQKALRDLSINLHFSAGRDNFSGKVKTLTRNSERAFDLLRLSLTSPRFDVEPLARMIAANKSRIRSSLSDPNWMAARILNDVAFADHPYALNSGGTLSTLSNINADDLREFTRSRLGKNNLHIGVAGDITKEKLSVLLDHVFGDLPDVDLATLDDLTVQNQSKVFLYEKDIPQSVIEILQPGIGRNHPDYHYAKIMNFVLGSSGFGSRLTQEIREKRGLTYGVHSSFYSLDHFKGLSVSTSTANANVGELVTLVHEEWKKMIEAPISAEELKNAKSYLVGALPLSLTSTEAIARLLLSLQLDGLPLDYLDQRNATIQGATIEDITRVSRDLLNTDKFVTVIVGKPENIIATDIIERLQNVE